MGSDSSASDDAANQAMADRDRLEAENKRKEALAAMQQRDLEKKRLLALKRRRTASIGGGDSSDQMQDNRKPNTLG